MKRLLNVTTSVLATVARLGYAERVGSLGPRPEKPLELYEFEACPFCRKVREAPQSVSGASRGHALWTFVQTPQRSAFHLLCSPALRV